MYTPDERIIGVFIVENRHLVQIALLQERQEDMEKTMVMLGTTASKFRKIVVVDICIAMNRQHLLLEIVGALKALCCLTCHLHSGQQQRDENGNHQHYHQ